jgi:seryl-tRNA synthetase
VDAVDGGPQLLSDLLAEGVLVESSVAGVYGKGRSFVRVFEGIDSYVTELGADQDAELYRFPPVFPRADLLRTDYLRGFPNLVGSIHSFGGSERDHGKLLLAIDSGADWARSLDPTEVVLVPAACYPIYPMVSGTVPAAGRRFDVLGMCFRHEPDRDPARMQTFHQHEFVYVGAPDGALAFRDLWLERSQRAMADLGLEVEAVVANDPFFGRAGQMLATNQLGDALKFEIVAPVASREKRTAIVSCNCHKDHLTAAFEIQTDAGEIAHSACVGFGLERIVLALFAAYGADLANWPSDVSGRLT